jgi:hypothetical protein
MGICGLCIDGLVYGISKRWMDTRDVNVGMTLGEDTTNTESATFRSRNLSFALSFASKVRYGT